VNRWETTRDVLVSKEKPIPDQTIRSRYEYSVNNLGQRVNVQQSGNAFSQKAFTLYGYDENLDSLQVLSDIASGTLTSPESPGIRTAVWFRL